MYKFDFSKNFLRKLDKINKKDKQLAKKIVEILNLLKLNPKTKKIKSHKVSTNKYGLVWSSKVTGDIRLIWNYKNKSLQILILTLASHSGKSKVYK